MNYPEYILRRSEALWKEQQEIWQRELATAAGVARKNGAGTETAEGENAVKRLAEKLFSAGGEAAAEAVQRFAAQERGIRGESGGARWLADELRRGATEGVAPERVQERTADSAPIYGTADFAALSQSVERDARRYDGGFLLY